MSKMDRQLNSKKDKETIYEIYRACRLCGAGAGYKMPIIQNVVDLGDSEVEFRQKVRDCVQIEVHQDDKMPPLICELCVDKVNDFYEFLEMCRQTNKRTRVRLGLPPQSMPRGAPDAGECILGLTEPVYVNDDSDGEPLSKQKKMNPKVKVKREPVVQLENRILTESRSSRSSKRAPTPPRMTRNRTTSKEDNVSLSRFKDTKVQKPAPTPPKSILKKEIKSEGSPLTQRSKRTRDKEPVKLGTPTKRVKIETPKSPPKPPPRPPRPAKPVKSPPASPPRVYKCAVCGQANKTVHANSNHLKTHTVGFTSPKLACNPCGLWFGSADEAASHHKQHRNKSKPYNCKRCVTKFRQLSTYDEHFDKNQCIPFDEVPDVKCDECWHLFPTNKLLDDHKCLGEDHRPGGKCSKCRRSYALLRNLKKHELTCTAKKKGELILDPVLLGKLRPIQIRVSRCDPLLTNLKQEHYDVSNVTPDFGLDKNCVYPYISSVSSLRIKSDPDGMVDIQDEIKNAFYIEEDYIHWDSENTDSDEEESSLLQTPKKKKLDTLANLTLKTLFSKKCLGKVPKKKRRVKQEKNMFDSLLNETEDDVTHDINSIIDNLGDDDDLDGQKGDEETQKDKILSQKGDELNDSVKSMDVGDDNEVTDKVDDNVTAKNNKDNEVKSDEIDSSYETDKVANDSSKKNERNDVKSDENDICDDEVSNEKDISSASKNINSVCNETDGSNNNLSSNNENNSIEDKISNGTININNLRFDFDDGGVVSKKVNDISSLDSKDENQNDGEAESISNESVKIDYENSQDSNSIGGGSDSLLNNTESDKETIDNVTTLSEQNSENPKSQSIDNLSQDTEMTELEEDSSQNDEKQTDFSQNDEKETGFSQNDEKETGFSQNDEKQTDFSHNTDSVNENDYKNAISVIVNSGKSKPLTDSEEENSKLMEALDAQIGENNDISTDVINNENRGQINDNFNDKIALEDLISAKNNDIDMIPEEFNFDA